MMPVSLEKVRPGDVIKATDWNSLVDCCAELEKRVTTLEGASPKPRPRPTGILVDFQTPAPKAPAAVSDDGQTILVPADGSSVSIGLPFLAAAAGSFRLADPQVVELGERGPMVIHHPPNWLLEETLLLDELEFMPEAERVLVRERFAFLSGGSATETNRSRVREREAVMDRSLGRGVVEGSLDGLDDAVLTDAVLTDAVLAAGRSRTRGPLIVDRQLEQWQVQWANEDRKLTVRAPGRGGTVLLVSAGSKAASALVTLEVRASDGSRAGTLALNLKKQA